mgnify:CR=1 FL=1
MICDLLFTRLSAVRKVLETLLFQALGIIETLGSIISHGTSKKFADVRTHLRKVSKRSLSAIKKEPGIFDLKQLQKVAQSLPGEYEMRLIDQELFEICRDTQWSKDLTANYESYSQYKEYGLGVCILTGGEVVAGISSYSGYGRRSDENLGCHGGIEIEVVTREDYRRKGLAYIGAARLLLECDKRGLYPNWDAANKMSVGLAEKLGYHFSHEYVVYKVKK